MKSGSGSPRREPGGCLVAVCGYEGAVITTTTVKVIDDSAKSHPALMSESLTPYFLLSSFSHFSLSLMMMFTIHRAPAHQMNQRK